MNKKPSIWVVTFYAGQIIEPEAFENKPVFGSELALLEVFQRLGKIYDVSIFIHKQSGYQFQKYNITWRSETDWNNLISSCIPDNIVISRYLGAMCDLIIPTSCKLFLWCHDTCIHPSYKGAQLPPPFANNMSRRITRVVTVGDSQREEIMLKHYTIEREKYITIKNGVNLKGLEPKTRGPMSFVYASAPDRGLVKLLRMWPRILQEWPYASLQIFHNLSDQDKEAIGKWERVFPIGKVNQKTLFDKLQYVDYWVYPSIFYETCCTTAIEMAYHGPICITNDLGALKENNIAGIIIPRDNKKRDIWYHENVKDEGAIIDWNFEHDLFLKLRYLEAHPEEKDQIRNRQRAWASLQTWDKRAEEWDNLLKNFTNYI